METNKEKVVIGSDHAGFALKEELKKYMTEKGIKFLDLGSFSTESVDYPDIAREVCEQVVEEEGTFGVLICGTGIGMSIAANRREGIRAAYCTHELLAKMSRLHNNANVLCMGGRILGIELAKSILDTFLNTNFSNEERHEKRIEKIDQPLKPGQKPLRSGAIVDNAAHDIAD